MASRTPWLRALSIGVGLSASQLAAGELSWRKLTLSDKFYAEAAAFGDLNGDGRSDVIAGPYWYEGPSFERRHEIYPAVEFDPLQYSDNFTVLAYDFSGDGREDVAVVGFPGGELRWYENPKSHDEEWKRHTVFPSIGNESALLTDLDGDGRPELLGNFQRRMGYATWTPDKVRQAWKFHPVTPPGDWQAFTHGLGVGDIDGDGQTDLIERRGWWRQPETSAGDGTWVHQAQPWGDGGAQMLVMDVNEDGKNDVITSLKAHGYGLSWFEQRLNAAGETVFHEHRITSTEPQEQLQGVQFSQLHALAKADLDGDGVDDFVTGKRWWAHGPNGDPEPNAPAVLYGFLLRRAADGMVHFEPHLIDEASGVGTQIDARDINGDGRADVAVANKRGVFVFLSGEAAPSPHSP